MIRKEKEERYDKDRVGYLDIDSGETILLTLIVIVLISALLAIGGHRESFILGCNGPCNDPCSGCSSYRGHGKSRPPGHPKPFVCELQWAV